MGDQILDERNGFLVVGGSDLAGKGLAVFPAAVVFRGIDYKTPLQHFRVFGGKLLIDF